MKTVLCKFAHFIFPQIFSEWQPIDSTQQDTFLRAAGIAKPEQWDSQAQWVMKWFPNQAQCLAHFPFFLPLSVSLSFSLSLEYSTSSERFPCSQHGRADAGWKTFFSPLHLGEKMSLFLASVGIRLSQLSSMRAGTVCECQFSTFPFSQT